MLMIIADRRRQRFLVALSVSQNCVMICTVLGCPDGDEQQKKKRQLYIPLRGCYEPPRVRDGRGHIKISSFLVNNNARIFKCTKNSSPPSSSCRVDPAAGKEAWAGAEVAAKE